MGAALKSLWAAAARAGRGIRLAVAPTLAAPASPATGRQGKAADEAVEGQATRARNIAGIIPERSAALATHFYAAEPR